MSGEGVSSAFFAAEDALVVDHCGSDEFEADGGAVEVGVVMLGESVHHAGHGDGACCAAGEVASGFEVVEEHGEDFEGGEVGAVFGNYA